MNENLAELTGKTSLTIDSVFVSEEDGDGDGMDGTKLPLRLDEVEACLFCLLLHER